MLDHIVRSAFLLIFFAPALAAGVENPGENLKPLELTTELGDTVAGDTTFLNQEGEEVRIAELVARKPTILVPAYYTCPRLCGLLLTSVQELLEKLTLSLEEEYQVVTISFDPEDTPERARTQFEKFAAAMEGAGNWHFLSGEEEDIYPLMKSIGFKYFEDKGEFAHTAAIFILTAEGRISQYFTGLQFSPRDVRLALVEASSGQIGSALDQVLLYCYRFDPTKGKYTMAAFNVVRAGGAVALVFLVGLIFRLRMKERADRKGV